MSVTQEASASFHTSSLRPPAPLLVLEAFRELLSRRRLVGYLVKADLQKKGSDTLLGNLWWVIDPLLQMAIYYVLVTIIFHRDTPAYPLFIFAAILPWKWFTSSVQEGVRSVTMQERLIKQVYFPKLVLPTAATMAGVMNFAFGMIPLVAMTLIFYIDRLSPYILLIPVIAVVQFVFTLSMVYIVSSVNVFFRDVGNLTIHILRLWFYLSPGLYDIHTLRDSGPAKTYPIISKILTEFNPFAILFSAYRDVVYNDRLPEFKQLAELLGGSIVFLLLATYFFKRLEPAFAKVL